MLDWTRRDALEASPPPPPPLVLTEDERRWDAVLGSWREARRLERLLKRVVRGRGLSLERYLALDAAERLIRANEDACSQLDIVGRTGLTKSSVSHLVHALGRESLVDVQPDPWCRFDRIWVTKRGKAALALVQARVADALRDDATATKTL